MNCRNPYVGAKTGCDERAFRYSKAARQAVTPFPCGQCLACRINRSREWTTRMMLEQYCHNDSCFLTLTYEDDKLPMDDHGTPILEKQDIVDFLKRLRYYKDPGIIRHFAVGEYGDDNQRPHYHLALFGVSYFEQTLIEKAWKHGFYFLGELNQNSARYIVNYVIKNLRKPEEEELYGRPPEFMLSSRGTRDNRMGGIGRPAVRTIADSLKSQSWFKSEIIREVRFGGRKMPLGRYLTRKLADDLGINEDKWESAVSRYQYNVWQEYQKEGEKTYYQNILKTSYQKAINLETKQEIFKQKRNL